MGALEKRPPLFGGEEYARRLALTRVAMEEAELDALIVSDPANMAWLTGYDGWSFYMPQAVLMTMKGAPYWWGRAQDAAGARVTCWMADVAIRSYPETLAHAETSHPYQDMAGLLIEIGLGRARVGVELDSAYFTAACIGQLLNVAAGAQYVDATGLVNRQRLVKSEPEIAMMRRAGALASRAHGLIAERIAPGMRKCDLIADVYRELIRTAEDGSGAFGGDYPAIAPIAPSGAEAAAAHLTWDDQPLAAGEATYVELAGCRHRYHCPQSRTYHLGKPSDLVKRAEDASLEAIDAAMAAAKPGALAEDVAEACFNALAKHGFPKESRCGYGVGLGYPPDWGERSLSLRKGDETELEAGATFHLMPAIWREEEGFGMAISETLLVTESGGEALAETPREVAVAL